MSIDAALQAPSSVDRLRAAQRALAAAEALTGLRSALPAGDSFSGGTASGDSDSGGGSATSPVSSPPPSVHPFFPPASAVVGDVAERLLPVPPALASLVPLGGLRRGSTVRIERSTSLLLAVASAACRDGAWCALVGMPDVGLAAAVELGLSLDRSAVVPEPGPDASAVLGALIDGFDVIVLGDVPGLQDRDRRRLATRVRHREAVLLTSASWPGADLVLTVSEARWNGIGRGYGSLRGREMTVQVTGRGAAGGRGVRARLCSPDGVRFVTAFGTAAAEASRGAVSVSVSVSRGSVQGPVGAGSVLGQAG